MVTPKKGMPGLCLQQDLTDIPRYKDSERRLRESLRAGSNDNICDFLWPEYSPDGAWIAGLALTCSLLVGRPQPRFALVNAASGHTQCFDHQPGTLEVPPKWSPDGTEVAFVSQQKNMSTLHLLDHRAAQIRSATTVEGTIEQVFWAPDGLQIGLIVAESGADGASVKGARPTVEAAPKSANPWQPTIDIAVETNAWRDIWLYDCKTTSLRRLDLEPRLNVWEATWVSPDSIAGLCSDLPGEDHWYDSTLRLISLDSKQIRVLLDTGNQMGFPRSSPDGQEIAVISGLASDRGLLFGDLFLVNVADGTSTQLNTNGVDVAHLSWPDNRTVSIAGSKDNQTFVYECVIGEEEPKPLWKSDDCSLGDFAGPQISAVNLNGTRVIGVRSGWFSPPTLVELSSGQSVREVVSFASAASHEEILSLGKCDNVKWHAPDGLAQYGYLLQPNTPEPHKTVLLIHGGPVWQWRPQYLGAFGVMLMDHVLLAAGYAVFKPNVRGSSGRGQAFARAVYGDPAGKDTDDFMSGLDHLVEAGLVDGNRLGVFGNSYGGFMSCWLITQTNRFRAAVSSSPVTNWVPEMLESNIPKFARDFLMDDPYAPTSKFLTRSPLYHVRNCQTPVMLSCGTKDKCTPPGQAIEFHKALAAEGKTTLLLNFPEEGHGVKMMPTIFDYYTRIVAWFNHYV